MGGIEPPTYGLRNRCSTAELHWLNHLEISGLPASAGLKSGRATFAAGAWPPPCLLRDFQPKPKRKRLWLHLYNRTCRGGQARRTALVSSSAPTLCSPLDDPLARREPSLLVRSVVTIPVVRGSWRKLRLRPVGGISGLDQAAGKTSLAAFSPNSVPVAWSSQHACPAALPPPPQMRLAQPGCPCHIGS